MPVLLTPPKLQFFDNSGAPLAFGKVYTYAATGGTFSTPKATYTTQAGDTANANPVILDAAGRANIWIDGSYDFKVTDADDVQLYTQLAVTAFTALPAESDSYSETLSGNGTQTAFTVSEDLGTDENAIYVWVDNTNREYVTNGSFATDTGWTKGTGWTIGSGVATATGGISTAIEQSAAFTIDQYRAYTVTFTITRSAGTLTPSIGGTSGTAQNSSGTYTETIIAGSTQVIAFTGSGFTGTLDNVSVVVTNSAGFQIQPPANYTINGTTLTLTSAPASDTNNIFVSAPSLLVGAASSAAADAAASAAAALASEQAAADSETNAAASETAAADSETNAAASEAAAATSEDNAELWATGGTGGTPSSTNNAKYWSEQAEAVVLGDVWVATEQGATPSTPASGVSKLYFKTDGKLYALDDAGNEVKIGGGTAVISTVTASADATLEFTGLDGTYDKYMLILSNITMTTNDTAIDLQMGTGATPTWQTTSGDYAYTGYVSTDGGALSASGAGTAASIRLLSGIGSGTGESAMGIYTIENLASTNNHKKVVGHGCLSRAAVGAITIQHVAGELDNATTAVTAIRLAASSSTIAAGTATLLGINNS